MKGLRLRDARAGDREPVFEFCKKTWPEYGDYIPRVWSRWLRDPKGRLIVAEFEGAPVALGKVTDFGRGEIWLEGLRVDPGFRRAGIADAMHEEVMRTVKKFKPRFMRFCTGADNRASRRIGKKYGFEAIACFRYYWRKSRKGTPRGDLAARRDADRVYDFIMQSRFLRLSSGQIAEGWIFREMSRDLLAGYIRQRRVMVMRRSGRLSGVAVYPYEENEESTTLGFVDGDPGAIKVLARNCIYLAKEHGGKFCSAAVPARGFAGLIDQAGFLRKDSVGQVVLEHRRGRRDTGRLGKHR
ncbi:MAG: GNAT family N-acetyltransferase [Candidatus Eisenbacteria bacterium]